MTTKRMIGTAFLAAALLAPSLSWTARRSVILTDARVNTVTDADTSLGAYYVLDIPIPAGINEDNFRAALLEVVVTVEARELQGHVNEAPMLEVYRVTGNAETALSDETLARPSAACINLPPGPTQRIRLDVTEIIRHAVGEPEPSLEIAIGSLTGSRTGLFQVHSGTWGPRSVARLTFVTRE